MVRINRIYTKSGDDGSTGLTDGSRRRKSDLRLETYGTVDELNAVVGVATVQATADGLLEMAELLGRIQNDLFDLGADLSTPGEGDALRVQPSQVEVIEAAIDAHNADLEELRSFVLPGGTELSARLHLARTVCRRAERLAVALAETETIGGAVLTYLNRLGDLFFVLARVANDGGKGDVLWVPGGSRP